MTLSIITCVIKGFAKPNNCTKKEAANTVIKVLLYRLSEGKNQDKPNFCFGVSLVG